jgi:hypothetical protein
MFFHFIKVDFGLLTENYEKSGDHPWQAPQAGAGEDYKYIGLG